MQIQDRAIPGLMDIVSSEGISAEAKEEAEGILEELTSRKPDSRLPLDYSSIKNLSLCCWMIRPCSSVPISVVALDRDCASFVFHLECYPSNKLQCFGSGKR